MIWLPVWPSVSELLDVAVAVVETTALPEESVLVVVSVSLDVLKAVCV